VEDFSGDEADGRDEGIVLRRSNRGNKSIYSIIAILPLDWHTSGHILDDVGPYYLCLNVFSTLIIQELFQSLVSMVDGSIARNKFSFFPL
jgi:hypothetical protein